MAVSKPRKYFAALVAGMLAGCACLIFVVYTRIEDQRVSRECEANLKTIWDAIKVYAYESPGELFPPLAHDAGRLMFDAGTMYPDILHDSTVLVSPAHPDASELLNNPTDNAALIDDHSYWYLGYVVLTNRSFQSFVDDYKIAIMKGEPTPERNEIWPEFADEILQRRQALGPTGWASGTLDVFSRTSEVFVEEDQRNFRLRLSDGVVRHYSFAFENPLASLERAARAPILIERPELHGDGGHVLYLDGHVEFVPYPGKFPMTKEFIAGLREIDALGESEAAN
jgi:prepilin-type processing-associated H-X9-DG protein